MLISVADGVFSERPEDFTRCYQDCCQGSELREKRAEDLAVKDIGKEEFPEEWGGQHYLMCFREVR